MAATCCHCKGKHLGTECPDRPTNGIRGGPTRYPHGLGLYWAKFVGSKSYTLIKVEQCTSNRSRRGLKSGEPNVSLYVMGWDCPVPMEQYTDFVKAHIFTPNGELYQ